jgi:hypothetical protein
MKDVMKRPLITGASVSADWASVSADWASASPGKRLALRYTSADNIRVKALGGRRGYDTVAALKESDFEDRTAIIAVDAFFWDSTRSDSKRSIEAMRNLTARAEKMNIPLVLGEIPQLLPGQQPSYKTLNDEIHRLCTTAKQCFVMPLDKLVQQIARDHAFTIKGRRYGLSVLVPDGLHINDVASDYLADLLEEIMSKS